VVGMPDSAPALWGLCCKPPGFCISTSGAATLLGVAVTHAWALHTPQSLRRDAEAPSVLLRRCQIPRVELKEMGPALDLALRRHRLPAPDLEKEALRQPKVAKKKARRPWVVRVMVMVSDSFRVWPCAMLRFTGLCGRTPCCVDRLPRAPGAWLPGKLCRSGSGSHHAVGLDARGGMRLSSHMRLHSVGGATVGTQRAAGAVR